MQEKTAGVRSGVRAGCAVLALGLALVALPLAPKGGGVVGWAMARAASPDGDGDRYLFRYLQGLRSEASKGADADTAHAQTVEDREPGDASADDHGSGAGHDCCDSDGPDGDSGGSDHDSDGGSDHDSDGGD